MIKRLVAVCHPDFVWCDSTKVIDVLLILWLLTTLFPGKTNTEVAQSDPQMEKIQNVIKISCLGGNVTCTHEPPTPTFPSRGPSGCREREWATGGLLLIGGGGSPGRPSDRGLGEVTVTNGSLALTNYIVLLFDILYFFILWQSLLIVLSVLRKCHGHLGSPQLRPCCSDRAVQLPHGHA